jgi:hypothetical protein
MLARIAWPGDGSIGFRVKQAVDLGARGLLPKLSPLC